MTKLFGKTAATTKTTTTTTVTKPGTGNIKTDLAIGLLFASAAFMGAAAYKGIEWASDKIGEKIDSRNRKCFGCFENTSKEVFENSHRECDEAEAEIERVREEIDTASAEFKEGMKQIHENLEKEEDLMKELLQEEETEE